MFAWLNIQNNNSCKILVLLFLLLYLIFPSQNSSIDAYNYAANLKWQHDLFFPHHLLYNYFHFVILKILSLIGFKPDVLAFMKVINAVFATACLFLLSNLLRVLSYHYKLIFSIILFVGSSFGIARFATENETYIIPIFWSLLASYYYLKYLKYKLFKNIVLSGIYVSIACLFHQIHIFWYIGLALGILFYIRNRKVLILFSIPSLLVPLVYYLAFIQNHFEFSQAKNIWQFVLYDYYYGTARLQFGIHNLILGFISFVRSFIQIHGITLLLVKKINLYTLVFIPFTFFCFLAFRKLWNYGIKKSVLTSFIKTHILIFILHLAFAIFSDGNAEFMVMLPFLFLIILSNSVKIHHKVYLHLGLALLIWNFAFGLFPSSCYDFQNHQMVIQEVEKQANTNFILSESTLVQNMMYYKSGIAWKNTIYKSPETLKIHNKSDRRVKLMLETSFLNSTMVLTDCIDEPVVMNRKQYFLNNENSDFFKDYQRIKIDSSVNVIGTKYLYQILPSK